MSAIVIGVDPGPVTGICALHLGPLAAGEPAYSPSIIQCDHRSVLSIVDMLAEPGRLGVSAVLAVEGFVVSSRAARSAHAPAGRIARELAGELAALPGFAQTVTRTAAMVKPWATDLRLARAGLLDLCPGMPHARDAARHALYTAVRQFGQPDPLSARAGAQ